MTSIKGISSTIRSALIETTNDFRNFTWVNALAKFIDIAHLTYPSDKTGFSQGICKTGDPYLQLAYCTLLSSRLFATRGTGNFTSDTKRLASPPKWL
ncbi:MAG: transposase [Spirosoma sp.]|nr:transposase [Spirosoma sp.]